MYFTEFESPVCPIVLAGDEKGLAHLHLKTDETNYVLPDANWVRDDVFFEPVIKQILAYFRGERRHFDIALHLRGTPFQKAVWQALLDIPYGQTATYQMIAEAAGRPKACRAVGQANNRNPVALIVPCHRVIGKNGAMVGYGPGVSLKVKLLDFEAHQRSNSLPD